MYLHMYVSTYVCMSIFLSTLNTSRAIYLCSRPPSGVDLWSLFEVQFVFFNPSVSLSLSFWLLLFGSVSHVSIGFRRDVRQFFAAILWLVRPSVPFFFAVGRCFFCSPVRMCSILFDGTCGHWVAYA